VWLPRAEWGLAILLTGAALYLHALFFARAGGLWRDEVNSYRFASMPSLGAAYESLRYDSFPLLSTVLFRGWIHVGGGTDGGMRLLGLIVGILLLAAIWMTRGLFGEGPPLIALALAGLNPWVVRTVDSIRPYGWGIVMIVVTLGCVWKAASTSKPKWLLLTTVLSVAAVQCMYQNAFLLLAILGSGMFVAWRASRVKTALGILAAGAVAAISLLIYVPSVRAAGAWGVLIRTHIPLQRIAKVLSDTLGIGGPALLLIWIAFVTLAIVVALRSFRGRASSLPVFGAMALVLGAVLYLAALVATHVQTEPWYYVPLAVVAAVLLDGALQPFLSRGPWRLARFVIVLAAGAVLVFAAPPIAGMRCTNVDVAASRLEKIVGPGDLVILDPFWIGITFQRYYHGAAPWLTVPPIEKAGIVRYDRVKDAMARSGANEPVHVAMARTLQSGHRVYWIEGINTGQGAPAPLPPAPLPQTGWFIGPYLIFWGREAGHDLEEHGLQANIVDVGGDTPVIGYEKVIATEVTGWH
jgi:hypothetical protein